VIKNIKKNFQKLFKKISYNLFFFLYGEIKGIVKSSNSKNVIIFEKIKNNIKYNIYHNINSRLYTDTIHDTAIIFDKHILDGPSFQLRNNINSNCINNSVLTKGTPRFKKKIKGNVLSLLTGGGGNKNYYHWLFDVLPRLEIALQTINIEDINYFLFPDTQFKFQYESLDLLKIKKKKRLSSRKYRHIEADNIICTDHPYSFGNDIHSDAQNVPIWILDWLKKTFMGESNTETRVLKNYKKIYIDREDGNYNSRLLANNIEIKNLLRSYQYKIINLSNFSFKDQISIFNSADSVIGLHGAGFANLVFCRPNTDVVEIKVKSTGDMYKNIAKNNNLKYAHINGFDKENTSNIQDGIINIELDELKKKLLI